MQPTLRYKGDQIDFSWQLAAEVRPWRGVCLLHRIQPEAGASLWGSFRTHVWRHFLKMKECGSVYPNCRVLRTPIKLNEGHAAFRCLLKRFFFHVGWGALMMKDMKKRLPPQWNLLLTREHVVSHQQHIWERSISALLQACNFSSCCCLCFLHHSLPTFLIRFSPLKHLKYICITQCGV